MSHKTENFSLDQMDGKAVERVSYKKGNDFILLSFPPDRLGVGFTEEKKAAFRRAPAGGPRNARSVSRAGAPGGLSLKSVKNGNI